MIQKNDLEQTASIFGIMILSHAHDLVSIIRASLDQVDLDLTIDIKHDFKMNLIKMSRTERPHLVLLDTDLYQETPEVLNFIDRLRKTGTQLILCVPAEGESSEIINKLNPDFYMPKPVRTADLQIMLKVAIACFNKEIERQKSELRIAFTPKEKMILKLITNNKTTKEIADILHVSASTIKNHRHNICVKLGLHGGTHALTTWAMRNKSYLPD